MGDLFEPVLALKQKLPKLAGIEEAQPHAIASGIDIATQPKIHRRKSGRQRVSRLP